VANSDVIEDPVQAASALRTCLKSCTHTWTRNHSAILHSLSGGLDSSIVLSSLADSPYKPKVTCATYYMPGGNSDERPYVRLAAAQYRCDYIERPRKLAATQFRDLLRLIPLVNPLSGGYYCLEFEAVEHQLAQELGIDGHCSGNPGDTVL